MKKNENIIIPNSGLIDTFSMSVQSLLKTSANIEPPPEMLKEISAWVTNVYNAWLPITRLEMFSQEFGDPAIAQISNLVIMLISSGASEDVIWERLESERDDLIQQAKKLGPEKVEELKVIKKTFIALGMLMEEVVRQYEFIEENNVEPRRAVPDTHKFRRDLSGWQHESLFNIIKEKYSKNANDYDEYFSVLTIDIIEDEGGTYATGPYGPVITIGLDSSLESALSTLEHELTHYCQSMVNTIIYGWDKKEQWSYGMPKKKHRDKGIYQRQLFDDEEMDNEEEGYRRHLLDDRELAARINSVRYYVKKAVQSMDKERARKFISAIMNTEGGAEPWMDRDEIIMAIEANSVLRPEKIKEHNPDKWGYIMNVLLKEIEKN